MTKNLVLLNAEVDALTVSWSETSQAVRYILQYRKANDDDEAFTTLSDNLKSTQVRKKNLVDENGSGFLFRVAAILKEQDAQSSDWTTHAESFRLLTSEEASTRMQAPKVFSGGSAFAGIVSWSKAALEERPGKPFRPPCPTRK